MSDELLEFLKVYLEWANDPENNPHEFLNYAGLCTNLLVYAEKLPRDDIKLILEFKKLLKEEFGKDEYPFGGPLLYYKESDFNISHENEARLNWVKKKIEELESIND